MNPRATDWDEYYRKSAFTARFSRPFTIRRVLAAVQRYGRPGGVVAELGGANSLFYQPIQELLRPREYHVADTNRFGLDRLRQRSPEPGLVLHCENVLGLELPVQADLVFSIGLIEHFDPAGTREAVNAHFRLLKPGGIAIVTFPTPTWLYRVSRAVAEAAGVWAFPDERPLLTGEVVQAAEGAGELLEEDLIWQIVFTQRLTVFRKR